MKVDGIGLKRRSVVPALALLAAGLFSGSAWAIEKVACHVIVETGDHLVKLIETGNLSVAAESSLITESYTDSGAAVRVVEVVECVHYPNERFESSSMQRKLETMPH